MATNRWNAIVLGAGATGGWAAKKLTDRGLRVLLLEAGPELNFKEEFRRLQKATPQSPHEARANASPRQPIQSQCVAYADATKHYFVDDVDVPYATAISKPFPWIRMRLVGGRTALWSRVALRMSDRQLKATSVDGFGSDWPLSYEDLTPYYDEVEDFICVYGATEHHPDVPDGHCIEPPALTRAEVDLIRTVESDLKRPVLRLRQASLTQPGIAVNDPRAIPYASSAASTIARVVWRASKASVTSENADGRRSARRPFS